MTAQAKTKNSTLWLTCEPIKTSLLNHPFYSFIINRAVATTDVAEVMTSQHDRWMDIYSTDV